MCSAVFVPRGRADCTPRQATSLYPCCCSGSSWLCKERQQLRDHLVRCLFHEPVPVRTIIGIASLVRAKCYTVCPCAPTPHHAFGRHSDNAMNWSIRARLTAWYTGVVLIVLVVSAIVVALVQERRALNRLDEDLSRMMLTLHGMMREEFGEGHDVRRAATEASTEMALPDRAMAIADSDGNVLVTPSHVVSAAPDRRLARSEDGTSRRRTLSCDDRAR
jgi:hypothetical protein